MQTRGSWVTTLLLVLTWYPLSCKNLIWCHLIHKRVNPDSMKLYESLIHSKSCLNGPQLISRVWDPLYSFDGSYIPAKDVQPASIRKSPHPNSINLTLRVSGLIRRFSIFISLCNTPNQWHIWAANIAWCIITRTTSSSMVIICNRTNQLNSSKGMGCSMTKT